MYVFVAFDVEDLVHPDSDDIPRDVARMLADDGIVATMCVVGEKARLWERRGRRDVISAVGKHDVCLHTDTHSIHPTVAEYLAYKGWADGVAEALARERPGTKDLARVFGVYPSSWGTGGSSWGPQIPAATRQLGIPSNIYSHGCPGIAGAWWYAGQLCYPNGVGLPGGEDTCCDDAAFEARLPDLLAKVEGLARDGTSCALLFAGHPTRFRYTKFWDVINYSQGQNTDPAVFRSAPRRDDATYLTGLRNLRRMLLAARDLPGVQMTSLRALNGRFALESGPLAWPDVRRLARSIADSKTIRADDPIASPAQTLDLLARAVLRLGQGTPAPAHLPLRLVLGPTEQPSKRVSPLQVSPAQALAVCRALVAFVDTTHHLPAAIEVDGVAVSPGPLLRALAPAFLSLERKSVLEDLVLLPGAEEPEIAAELVQTRVYDALPGWPPHRPDLHLEHIALHTRLQTWSLKPATLS